MMYGLPAAAYAIYKTTPQEKKTKVKALMIAGAAAAFVTGITEPLEFSFLFIAPILYLFHAFMAGLGFFLMSAFDVGIGNTSGGFIDFILYGVLVENSKWYMEIVVGIFYAPIYYYVFKWYLSRKKISIDTSDEFLDTANNANTNDKLTADENSLEVRIINALGGKENIEVVNNCLTRLRVDLKKVSIIDQEVLKTTGALGVVINSDTHVQVIYGPKVEKIATLVREAL